MVSGVYLIENKNTKQKYIGQSINIERRWKEHCRGKSYETSYIDNAMSKYKKENFTIIILYESQDKDLLLAMEKYYIWKYDTYKNTFHYNLTPGGEQPPILKGKKNPNYNKKINKETKNKISKAHKGKKHSEKIKQKMSKAKNISGYYRVGKSKDKRCKQGFIWRYRYCDENGKHKAITSTDIKKLEKKVKEKGLIWIKF